MRGDLKRELALRRENPAAAAVYKEGETGMVGSLPPPHIGSLPSCHCCKNSAGPRRPGVTFLPLPPLASAALLCSGATGAQPGVTSLRCTGERGWRHLLVGRQRAGPHPSARGLRRDDGNSDN